MKDLGPEQQTEDLRENQEDSRKPAERVELMNLKEQARDKPDDTRTTRGLEEDWVTLMRRGTQRRTQNIQLQSQMSLINKSAKLMTKLFMSFGTLGSTYHTPHCPIWRQVSTVIYAILRTRKTRSYNITGQQHREKTTIRTTEKTDLENTNLSQQ